ncbi:hypothetical protein BDV93DRAFT_42708 [Ceratobasidium sp. AG-I]|nr:hypothetical protein BDV93DRAFT_42708 [Ceratobasidium sp. AG-I]
MVDASLGDTERTENPQRSGVRPHTQDGGWNSGSHGRDRGRQEGNRNGLDNNGSRYGRRGDFWRPDNDGYRDSPMRAWGKQDTGIQKEGPPSVAFVPNSDRSFVPRHAQGGNFVPREVRNRPPEGLPPKPPSPSQFRPPPLNTSGVYNQSSSSARARSPPRNRAQMFDADMADVAADLDISRRGPGAIAFFAASSPTGTPRKSSLLNRMTEPGGGDRSLMARLSGDQGGGDSQARGQRRPKISKPGPRR